VGLTSTRDCKSKFGSPSVIVHYESDFNSKGKWRAILPSRRENMQNALFHSSRHFIRVVGGEEAAACRHLGCCICSCRRCLVSAHRCRRPHCLERAHHCRHPRHGRSLSPPAAPMPTDARLLVRSPCSEPCARHGRSSSLPAAMAAPAPTDVACRRGPLARSHAPTTPSEMPFVNATHCWRWPT
jgi:hypothetical protein